jgi:hypothetical protein
MSEGGSEGGSEGAREVGGREGRRLVREPGAGSKECGKRE